MKTLIALGTTTLTQASAGECNDGRSRYSSSRSYVRFYVSRPQYVPSYDYRSEPCYTDPHHRYAAPRRDSYGNRVDSHGHHVDSHGHHRR